MRNSSVPKREKIKEMTFKTPVSYLRFDEEGKKLFVLTAEQEAFMIDTAKFKYAQQMSPQ